MSSDLLKILLRAHQLSSHQGGLSQLSFLHLGDYLVTRWSPRSWFRLLSHNRTTNIIKVNSDSHRSNRSIAKSEEDPPLLIQ